MIVNDHLGGASTLELKRAICLYEDAGQALATVHPVRLNKKGRPEIMAGSLLTRLVLDEMILKLSGIKRERVILPECVLCLDGSRMAWWTPAQRRPIFFQTTDKEFNKAMRGKAVLHPALVFIARPGVLSAFALADSKRPDGDTRLYRAPYPNLYEAGNMCAGNARLPSVLQIEDLALWERAFFDTNFTHANVSEKKLTNHPGGLKGLWKALSVAALAEDDCETFPWEWLNPAKLTLSKAVNL